MFKKSQLKKPVKAAAEKPLVLLIDDEIQNLNVLEGVLKRDYKIIACSSGQDALDVLLSMEGREKIKVIISDQRMPNMTGVEFFHRVKDIVPDALRIILTGYTDVSDIIDSINKANIYKFINKPFQPQDLLVTVLRACELFDINERLRTSERLKQEFINTVRHELRTPMNGIQGGIELLKLYLEEPADIENLRGENFRVIEESARQMMQIVTSILDFSTFDSLGKVPKMEVRVVDLLVCFKVVIRKHFNEAEAKGLSVEFNGLEDSRWVEVDINKVQEVLTHLLSNAVKFTSRGGIKVNLNCDFSDEAGQLKLSVKDTGIGVDPSLRERIFDMFVQGDGSFCRQYGGLGVGLTKAKTLVNHLGGKLWLDSTQGVGSEFFVEIPIVAANQLEDERSEKRKGIKSEFKGAPIIAVVEDNAINQLVLKKILEKIGCVVHIFSNGQEFAAWSKVNRANLVFMDCQMPVMNGYEATKIARSSDSLNQDTPIVACTANVSEDDREHCFRAGMDGFLAKPISITSVKNTLAEFVGFGLSDSKSWSEQS